MNLFVFSAMIFLISLMFTMADNNQLQFQGVFIKNYSTRLEQPTTNYFIHDYALVI